MDNLKNAGVAVVVALLVSLIVSYFVRPNIEQIASRVADAVKSLGAIPSDVVTGNYFTIGGVPGAYVIAEMNNATSSEVCTFVNPFAPATTSYDYFSAQVTTGMTGTNVLSLSTTSKVTIASTTGSGADGSSTPSTILDHSIASGAQDTVFWPPGVGTTTSITPNLLLVGSLTDGSSPFFLTGTSAVVWRIASSSRGSIASGNGYRGTCKMRFWKN